MTKKQYLKILDLMDDLKKSIRGGSFNHEWDEPDEDKSGEDDIWEAFYCLEEFLIKLAEK